MTNLTPADREALDRTRADVDQLLREARARGERPALPGVDLREVNLRGVDLAVADLSRADLRGADLSAADLSVADLAGADLREVDLRGANLRGVDLREADLRGLNLRGADLRGAHLSGANLRGADLRGNDLSGVNLYGANLRGTVLSRANLHRTVGALSLGYTPSGGTDLRPLPDGTWLLTVGCWSGTTDDLRALITGSDWPSLCDADERDRRRPILRGLADQADALAVYHSDWLTAVVLRWGAGDAA